MQQTNKIKDTDGHTRAIHVVLIQPSEPFGKNAIIPQSLLELAAILKESSISVDIIDARLDNLSSSETIDLLKKKSFDLVGITGLNCAYRYIKDFCFEFKREFPEKPLIAGGHFIMSIPDLILKRVPIDVACTGEGDEIIVGLVKCLVEKKPLDGIHNIAYLKDGELIKTEFKLVDDMDRLPIPAYELLRMEEYVRNSDSIGGFHITTGRGCINHCYYCGSLYKKVRKLSPDKLIKIFDLLNEKYGVRNFVFSEENSFYPQQWLVDICTKLNELGREYNLAVAGCADHVTEEHCMALASIKGKATISIAVEHWNPDIQKKFYRTHQSNKIEQALDLFKKYNIPNRGISILWGHPDDTLASFRESFLKSLEIQKKYSISTLSVRALLAIPNSNYYRDSLKQGKIKDYEDFMYSTIGFAPFVNLSRYDDDIYRKFITELWLKKEIKSSTHAWKRLLFLAAFILLNVLMVLPKTIRQFFRKMVERIFLVPMYNPTINYYQKISCYEEILKLPQKARALVCYTHSRENLNKIFNSIREANIDLVGFIDNNSKMSKIYDYPIVSLENISELKPSHVILFSDNKNFNKKDVHKICPQVKVININCDNKFDMLGKGLDTWFTIEESKVF